MLYVKNARGLGAQHFKNRVSQLPRAGPPLEEFDLRDQLRPNPMHPAATDARRISDARLCFSQAVQFPQQFRFDLVGKPGANAHSLKVSGTKYGIGS
jgi:hypothetical protein